MKTYIKPNIHSIDVASEEIIATSPDFGTKSVAPMSFSLGDDVTYRTNSSGSNNPTADGNGEVWGDANGYRSNLWD